MSQKALQRQRRRGFSLYVVLGLIVLLLTIAASVFRDMRQRDVWSDRYAKGEQALALANAAVANVLFATRNALSPIPVGGGDLAQGPLFLYLLQDRKSFERAAGKLAGGSGDHAVFLEKMLGERALDPVKRLVSKHPGAKLELFVKLEGRGLGDEPKGKDDAVAMYSDSIEKSVLFRVAATVNFGNAVRTAWADKRLRVFSTLLPFTPRFTASSLGRAKGEDSANDLQNDPAGCPVMAGDAGPNRYFHRGELPDRPEPTAVAGEEGWLFFGSRPTHFRLTSGSEDFHLSAGSERPKARRPERQPPGVLAAHPKDPDDNTVVQSFWLQAGFFGYYEGMDPVALFGVPSLDDRSSRLHLFGDRAIPSPTRVLGPVSQRIAMFTDLAVDRDASDKDERDQRAACGRELPVREARDPFLKRVTAKEYEADTEQEKSCGPARNLIPFSSPGLPPHSVENLNARADLDGDGIPETVVASETGKEILHLSPCEVTYTRLFGTFDEYDPWACREVDVPMNAVRLLMKEPADEGFRRLAAEFLPYREHAAFQSEIVPASELKLPYRDCLHTAGELTVSERLHFDVTRAPDADVSEFPPEAVVGRRVTLQMSAEEFTSRCMSHKAAGGSWLNMSERVIRVNEPLVIPAGTKVASRGGGLLMAPSVRFEGDFLQPDKSSPFSLLAGSVDATAGTTLELAVFARGLGWARNATVVGSVGTGTLEELTSWQGCVVSWDGRYDPTALSAPECYRAEMSDRVMGAGVAHVASARRLTQ